MLDGVSGEASMHSGKTLRAGGQMRRQLAKQQLLQRQQQQQLADRHRSTGRDLPAKQDQTRHNPVTESQQRGSFTSDQ
jgi:hypothetical protein